MHLPLSQRVDSLTQLSDIDYILEAMQNLTYANIKVRVLGRNTPLFKEDTIYEDGESFLGEIKSNPRRDPPSYGIIAVTK